VCVNITPERTQDDIDEFDWEQEFETALIVACAAAEETAAEVVVESVAEANAADAATAATMAVVAAVEATTEAALAGAGGSTPLVHEDQLWPIFRTTFVAPRWAWIAHISEDEDEDLQCFITNPCFTCCHNPECPTHVNCHHCENIGEDCECDYCNIDFST
jgi:hypothetical protein